MINNLKLTLARFVKDKHGNVVIWQRPNVPILGWAVFKLLALISNGPEIALGFSSVSTALLFTWAFLEITSGASYFRRLLGLVVIAAIVVGYFT